MTFRHVERDGERIVAERDVVEGIVVYRPLQEAIEFAERLHPRGRGGRWINKLGGRSTVIGLTPYLKRRDPDKRKRANRGRQSFASAKSLHTDPRMADLFRSFEDRAEALAAEHKVKIVVGERNVGVFEGVFEPSYALRVRGKKPDIDAFNKALGSEFDQKAVVGFTPSARGKDAEVSFTGGSDPDAFYRALTDIMGNDAGASYDNGVWRVFVYQGDHETVAKLIDYARGNGMEATAIKGDGDYFQLREGAG